MNLTGLPPYQKGQKRRRVARPEVVEDKAFRKWLRSQKCCVCGRQQYADGEMKCEAAHVRLGGRGGVAMKPLFSAVPLCRDHHGLQHDDSHTAIADKEWWLAQADKYLAMWKCINRAKR